MVTHSPARQEDRKSSCRLRHHNNPANDTTRTTAYFDFSFDILTPRTFGSKHRWVVIQLKSEAVQEEGRRALHFRCSCPLVRLRGEHARVLGTGGPNLPVHHRRLCGPAAALSDR